MNLFPLFLDGAAAAGDVDPNAGWLSLVSTLLPFAAIIVVFYFLLIRPESKRKKATAKMRSELIIGDEVTTVGGMIGKIVNIKDDEITIESGADKVRVKFVRWAISGKGQQATE